MAILREKNMNVIDAVITWVDGNEPLHQGKRLKHLKNLKIEPPKAAIDPTRFNQCGEINYCVKSIFKFAPWIRNIYIVTDAQIPPTKSLFKGTPYEERIKLVDHRDIFSGYEHCLPTFNSVTIESMLWRIEGLAENFIYFNDDCFLIRPVIKDDFFYNDQLILRGQWKMASSCKLYAIYHQLLAILGKHKGTTIHRATQENSAELAGIQRYFFHLPHVPFPLKKSTFAHFFSQHPEKLQHNIQFSLRDQQQFLPVSLAHHLALQLNNGVIDRELKAIGISADRYSFNKVNEKLVQAEKDHQLAFMCVQSMDMATPIIQNHLHQWLETWLH